MRIRLSLLLVTLSALLMISNPGVQFSAAPMLSLPRVTNPIVYHPATLAAQGTPPFIPADIRKAYNFAPLYQRGINGTGTRIAIIDAFGSPSLSTDLATFDTLTGLPPANVNTYYPDGIPKATDQNWAVETSLDVEWAHAIAPGATIDLVIPVDYSVAHVFDALAFVANSLTNETVLSMSFTIPEASYPTSGPITIATTHQLFESMTSHGTTPFASSGDSAAFDCCRINYPASDPLVVAVGGTTLTLNHNATYLTEDAWFGSTAGASSVFPKPSYQQGLGDNMRDNVDVSYVADPYTGVLVVQGGTSLVVGGTSAGSPQWAALIALASQARSARFGAILPQLYKLSTFHDVVTGTDGYFDASKGWDYPTGLGSPDASALVDSLGAKADVAVTAINLSKNFAYAGVASGPILVNVTVETFGIVSETFNVELRANTTTISTQIVTLSKGSNLTLTFKLNTVGIPKGNYFISAQVSPTPGNASPPKNNFQGPGLLNVRLAGDANNDCKVDIVDLVIVASAMGTTPFTPGWNPSADFDNDGIVNTADLSVVGSNFGRHC